MTVPSRAGANASNGSRLDWKLLSTLLAAAGLGILIAANAHLVYVAFQSQPDCVPHVKTAGQGEDAPFRAARSAC
jgi:hypothetical protein